MLENVKHTCFECKYLREYESVICSVDKCGTDFNTPACADFMPIENRTKEGAKSGNKVD